MRRTRMSMLLVAVLSTLVVFAIFYLAWTRYTVALRTDELSRQTVALASGLSAGGPLAGGETASELRSQLFRVQASLIGARLLITDESGTVELSSASSGLWPGSVAIDSLDSANERGVRTDVRSLGDIDRVLVVAAPIQGAGWLVALQPVSEISAASRWVAILLLLSATIALLVAWGAASVLARRLTAPLLRLRSGAEAISAGEWGYQVPEEGDSEVASLAASFNTMSSRVANAYAAQKHFVGDVSHELRTPIASIQGFAGALLDGTVSDEETSRRFVSVIRQEAQRLGDLTSTLLALADFDAGRVEIAREPIDVDAMSVTLLARHEDAAESAGISLSIGALSPGGVRPVGDEARLLQVASALLSNALRYTPADGRIAVTAEASDGEWRLIVDDSGPGIPEADRERVFERFVRLDASRSVEGGGSGLGLSICERLVTLMEGTISASESPLGGARFTVVLPVRPRGAQQ